MGCLSAILFISFIAFMMGFFDIVERTYQTKEDAVSDRLFERGWLPEFIPDSATNISVTNNVDINTSRGTFDFLPADSNEFIDAIQNSNDDTSRHGTDPEMQHFKDSGYLSFNYSDRGACWVFLIHPDNGKCEYWASVNYL